jgi:hypothetical protein
MSTGQLCIEVNESEEQDRTSLPWPRPGNSIFEGHLTCNTNLEETLLSNMSLDFIHTIFSASSQGHWMNISAPGTIFLGSPCLPTHNCAHRFNPFSELLVSDGLGSGDVWVSDWEYPDIYIQPNEGPVMLPNGWTRYDCPFFKP